MKPIKYLILTIIMMISVQAFSVAIMAQPVEEKDLIIEANITGEVKPGLKSQLLEGSIEISGTVDIQKGDYFILGFDKANGQGANELILFDKLPKLKVVHKGKTLVGNKDFTMELKEGKVVIYFNTEITGNLDMRIDSLQVNGDRKIVERAYYMVMEEHLSGINEKVEIQQVNINYKSFSNFGGKVTFTADSHNCEMYRKIYEMKATAYMDTITGKMMVPLKDVLKILGLEEKHMTYSKGIFKVFIEGKYRFKFSNNEISVLDKMGNREMKLSQPIIINKGYMYIALEDLATVLNADTERNIGNNNIQTLYLPVHIWLED